MSVQNILAKAGPKKLLALDGGGIRGIITLQILAEIELLLKNKLKKDDNFVLGDYFDYIAGTSTGAIVATCLSLGWSVQKILRFYETSGAAMFDKAWLWERFHFKFKDEALAELLRNEIGGNETTLGTPELKTLLMVVMRNATTDSPWPISNNPNAKYNAPTRPDCNLKIPLWRLVRASTAAPTYFPPEVITIGNHTFTFVDGGVTTYNNPAFQLFLMATLSAYKLGWPTGEDKMLLVSVGTGTSPDANEKLTPGEMNLLYNAGSVPSALMFATLNEQDLLCRVLGKCLVGDPLDREVGDLKDSSRPFDRKLFTYLRYNVELTRDGLNALGLTDIEPQDVQMLDSVDHIADLKRVGQAVAGKTVTADDFPDAFNV